MPGLMDAGFSLTEDEKAMLPIIENFMGKANNTLLQHDLKENMHETQSTKEALNKLQRHVAENCKTTTEQTAGLNALQAIMQTLQRQAADADAKIADLAQKMHRIQALEELVSDCATRGQMETLSVVVSELQARLSTAEHAQRNVDEALDPFTTACHVRGSDQPSSSKELQQDQPIPKQDREPRNEASKVSVNDEEVRRLALKQHYNDAKVRYRTSPPTGKNERGFIWEFIEGSKDDDFCTWVQRYLHSKLPDKVTLAKKKKTRKNRCDRIVVLQPGLTWDHVRNVMQVAEMPF